MPVPSPETPADHEAALALVNTMQRQMAQLAHGIVTALKDHKVSGGEWMQLAMQGSSLALAVLGTLQGTDAATQQDMLFVLEHGRVTLDDGG